MTEVGRRTVLGAAAAFVAATPLPASAQSRRFPKGFLWGAATSAHQVDGNNVNSDLWLIEHLKPSPFVEPSGDACDSWNRHFEDIDLVARLGLTAYRFSVEWARIEPEPGAFSTATLTYYRRLAKECRRLGVAPVVTYNHFSLPRWVAARGGWEAPDIATLFARYCDRVARALGSLPAYHCTINEANQPLLPYLLRGDKPERGEEFVLGLAAKAVGSDRFGSYASGNRYRARNAMIAAHHAGGDAIRAAVPGAKVGITLALPVLEAVPGGETMLARAVAETRTIWFEACRRDEFIGVQNYDRKQIGPTGFAPNRTDSMSDDEGSDNWTDSLGTVVREAAKATGRPVLVTEHGINTADDLLRIRAINAGVVSLGRVIADGVPVVGYIHWSLIDNFEWLRGFKPKFGLCAIDRATFVRTPKPSAHHIGRIAVNNGLKGAPA
jgi:beta-glucosidase